MNKKIISVIMAVLLTVFSYSAVFAMETNTYNIINPQTASDGVTYSDNLFISVKVAENTRMRFTLHFYPNCTQASTLNDVPAAAFTVREQKGLTETFNGSDHISFYTRQVKNIEPGLYSLKIEVLDDNKNILSGETRYFLVKPNAAKMANSSIYESAPSGKVLFFQSVFKSLFGSASEDSSE